MKKRLLALLLTTVLAFGSVPTVYAQSSAGGHAINKGYEKEYGMPIDYTSTLQMPIYALVEYCCYPIEYNPLDFICALAGDIYSAYELFPEGEKPFMLIFVANCPNPSMEDFSQTVVINNNSYTYELGCKSYGYFDDNIGVEPEPDKDSKFVRFCTYAEGFTMGKDALITSLDGNYVKIIADDGELTGSDIQDVIDSFMIYAFSLDLTAESVYSLYLGE